MAALRSAIAQIIVQITAKVQETLTFACWAPPPRPHKLLQPDYADAAATSPLITSKSNGPTRLDAGSETNQVYSFVY